jgi:hypothetical protein
MNNTFKAIGAVLVIIAMFFGAYQYVDNKYALAKYVQLVEMRLDQKIEADNLENNQQRLWDLERKYGKNPSDPDIDREMKELREIIEMQKEKLRNILKDYYKGKA